MSGYKLLALATLSLLAGTAWAQDEAACDPAALSDLRSQLEAAQASRSSCTEEAAGLKDKLQQAEASLAANAAALKELESKLAAGPDVGAVEKERAELQAAAQAAKDSLAAAEGQLADATRKLSEATDQLARAEGETAALKKAAQEAQAAAEAARSEAGSCASKHATCEGSLKAAADEAAAKVAAAASSQEGLAKQLEELKAELARVRSEAAAAKASLTKLEAAWLPRWAEQATRQAAASVGPALDQAKQYAAQGTQAAQALWHARGKPALNHGLAFARTKSAELNAAIEARAGDSWPKAKAAAGAAWTAARGAALQAWHSPALAAVRPALAKAYGQASAQAAKVQGELEQLLISLLSRHNATVPLARRPYVTYLVYAALVVPLVAFGLPLLGLRRAPKPRVGENGPSSTPSSARKKKRTTRAH